MNEAVRNPAAPIIEIENLSISFFTRKGEIPAVMDFSCTVMPGEAMGIVGDANFLPSLSIVEIGAKLVRPAGAPQASGLTPSASPVAPPRSRRTPEAGKGAAGQRGGAASARKTSSRGAKRTAAKRRAKARRKRATR